MKRLVPVVLIAFVAVAFAPAAQPAGPSNKQLARQIKALQAQVKTLKKQVTEARAAAATALVYSGCATAVTADAFQGTWTEIDQVAGRTIFGPQTPVSDYTLCSLLQIQRAPTQVPPNVSVFNSLLVLFR